MGYLVDTCIWIDVERGTLLPHAVAAVLGNETVFLSPVTLAELKFGAERAKNSAMRQQRLAALARLQAKPVLHIDAITGQIFGEIAAQLVGTGHHHNHRVQDLWLASQAVQHKLTLVTHNRKDFADIVALSLLIWPDAGRLAG